ncbi:hypothetical protein SAMN02982927_02516 [Sporolactobacillus nakayamae]|uniref:Uncharacterized protein n=1 Tax=Sporolactobacillus nakayamae TaxID=269670 RepID=A0A1I2U186_9BACL|nr:hypothetical protein SAMN02982927_02516 [Sporolactobacillus nakayamae]
MLSALDKKRQNLMH